MIESEGLDLLKKYDNSTRKLVYESFEEDVEDINDYFFHISRKRELMNRNIPVGYGTIDVWEYRTSDLYDYNDIDSDNYRYFVSDEDEIEELLEEILDSKSLYIQISTLKYTYVFLNRYARIHRCSNCNELFADYLERFQMHSDKRKIHKDYCLSCFRERKYETRKANKKKYNYEYFNGVAASKAQRYIAMLIGGELNAKVGKYRPDIRKGKLC